LIDGEHQAIIELTSRQSIGKVRLDLHSLHTSFLSCRYPVAGIPHYSMQ
jgi:hypothetical protein